MCSMNMPNSYFETGSAVFGVSMVTLMGLERRRGRAGNSRRDHSRAPARQSWSRASRPSPTPITQNKAFIAVLHDRKPLNRGARSLMGTRIVKAIDPAQFRLQRNDGHRFRFDRQSQLAALRVAETGLGTTVLGAANVLMLSTAAAVSVSPFADLIVIADDLRIDIYRLVRIEVRDFEPKLAGSVPGGDCIHSRQATLPWCKCRRRR